MNILTGQAAVYFFLVYGSYNNNPRFRVHAPESLQYFYAGSSRQDKVEKDHVRFKSGETSDRFFSVLGFSHNLMTELLQQRLNNVPRLFVIFDQQYFYNTPGPCSLSSPRRARLR